ncbi:MAG: hypothetical protein ACYC4K_10395, partial [Thiobacillus sp.]
LNDADVGAMGRFCGVEGAAMPDIFSAGLLGENKLIVLDQLKEAGQYGDGFGWREAISTMERDWFTPLLVHLRWHSSAVRLLDLVNGKSLFLNRLDCWKIWRRPRALI